MDPFCYLCFEFVFLILSWLFLTAWCSPAGKGLTSCLLCVVIFPYCVPGQVWYSIVSIPDICHVPSFAIIPLEKRAGCRTFIVFRMLCCCFCSLPLPHDAVGWSVVCDRDISWSYILVLSIYRVFSRFVPPFIIEIQIIGNETMLKNALSMNILLPVIL